MRLRVGHQHSQFWPILAHFMDYYSLFWGPGVISTIDEPRVVFMCRSSTTQFWLFWSISWTINHRFGLPERFSQLKITGMPLRVRRQHSQFWPILTRFVDYYSPIFGPKRFPELLNPKVRYVLFINTRHFGRFWPVSWAITHRFGVPGRFLWLLNPNVRLRACH